MLGLVAAASWGSGDFGGGLISRRIPVLGLVLVSQVVGMVLALGMALLRGETMPLPEDLPWSLAGGITGAVGIVALYRGLAVGRMGIVAPVTGVLAASIPVVFGIIVEGPPAMIAAVGIGLAILAVVLVSLVEDEGGRPSGAGLALVAGVAIGAFGVAISQISEGHAFGPLAIIRATQGALIVLAIVVGRAAWRAERRWLPAMAGVGVLDMTGNAAFILAVQAGSLAIAAILSSLYPVTTVILATIFLHERVTRSHAVGIVLAAAAIVCIAAGSA